MIKTIENLLSIIIVGLIVFSVITSLIVSIAKSFKNKKFTQVATTIDDIVNAAKEQLVTLKKQITQASEIEKREEVSNDETVKETVMEYIEKQCKDNGMEFDEEYWLSQVEALIKEIKEKEGEN